MLKEKNMQKKTENMLKALVKMAGHLDEKGFSKEASELDRIIERNMGEIKKLSGFLDKVHIEETPEFAEYEAREEFEAELIKAADAALFLLKIMSDSFSQDTLYDLADMLVESAHSSTVDAVSSYVSENNLNIEEDLDSKDKDHHRDEIIKKILTKEDHLNTSAEILKIINKK